MRALLMLFLALALPALALQALLAPTGEIPDEVAHIIRAESVSHGILLGHREQRTDIAGTWDSGVTVDPVLIETGFTFKPGTAKADKLLTRDRLAELQRIRWSGQPAFVSIPNTAVYPPVLYIASAAGLRLGRALGLGPYQSIYIARGLNLLCYAAGGAAALLLARRCHAALFITLLLPMSLSLAASCNQDGLVIAAAVLAVALLTRAELGAWWAAVLLIALIVMAKPVYAPLAGVPAFLMPPRRQGIAFAVAGLLGGMLPGLAWFLFAQHEAAVPFRVAEFGAGPLWPGEPGQRFLFVEPRLQLQTLLARPALVVLLPIWTIAAQASLWWREFVGVLGTLDILLPDGLYRAWSVALPLAMLASMATLQPAARPAGIWGTLGIAVCMLATVAAMFNGQYLSWTMTGREVVEGIQGRYFLPLLPFLALMLPGVRQAGAILPAILLAPGAVLVAIAMVAVPVLLAETYSVR